MTIFVLLSIAAQFFFKLFNLLGPLHDNAVTSVLLHFLVPSIYMLFAISLSSEAFVRTANRKFSQASCDPRHRRDGLLIKNLESHIYA
jgi:hypothetical protein